ncbi:MAG: hypothetical protein N3A69_04285 [Leptospiraceae bacterium]|nr:hypothetical protein [Leptospiraceae bacterium]
MLAAQIPCIADAAVICVFFPIFTIAKKRYCTGAESAENTSDIPLIEALKSTFRNKYFYLSFTVWSF